MTTRPDSRARLAGGLLLWYGVLGGAVAWAVHLLVAWPLDELTCAAGSEKISAVPLWQAVGLAVVLPGLVTAGSLAVAALAWRRTARAQSAGVQDPAFGRSRMLAVVGIWANLLFLTIIVLGGVAVLVLPACQR
ncbi:hypothetical protein DLE60_24985 [Micromonospora globispora]|uniref:DUF2975 domain-containing protein n=1 Tax=Micromonospora globispora TaxID=1450148 RepID=A0A317JYM4_9ACTN|nr:hypothetical protein [Micromonospora globispora]PWU45685.1 hypothetical protein DLJ46_20655 [Micromonospora globispora]PWU57198.1 hypothetical protein DLE60_24985 [Micromonospora globispora]RQW81748.1 hypothetical protein DKL51_34730 [Micromonospora globispora]